MFYDPDQGGVVPGDVYFIFLLDQFRHDFILYHRGGMEKKDLFSQQVRSVNVIAHGNMIIPQPGFRQSLLIKSIYIIRVFG
jgi:hypothetical protein